MIAQWLVAAGAAIMLALGLLHLLFTFKGKKLHPRDPEVMAQMKSTPLFITRTATMWNAWIGFNASHSLGAILFGTVFGYLALAQPGVFFGSIFLGCTGFIALLAYVALARRFWFSRPLQGISAATALYVSGWLAALL